jgi:hypothetical protein
MSTANYALQLQTSLKIAGERFANAEGTSLNQLINVALAEKLSALSTEALFRDRAAKGNRDSFLAFLDGAGDEPPIEGDIIS